MAFDIAALKLGLKDRIADLVQTLAPDGTFKGQYYVPLNPTRKDRRPGSFFIWVTGERAGAFVESADGDKGDVIDLIAYCMRFSERGAALQWAEKWLHGEAVSRPQPTRLETKEKHGEQSPADKRWQAQQWFRSGRSLSGTIGEIYLAGRGIAKPPAPYVWPAHLSFLPRMKHPYAGLYFPGLIAAYSNYRGEIVAVHRTFLNSDGSGKAPVCSPRLSWPEYAGAAIRLNKGDQRHLVIVESIEDGLSVIAADRSLAVWAAGSLGNIGNLRLPQTERVTVFADNDWGKAGAQKQLVDALDELARQCGDLRVGRSPIGKDANDALRKGGPSLVLMPILEATAFN